MTAIKKSLRSITPAPLLSLYHFFLAFLAALLNGFPSRNLMVIGVTGTKGKSSTIEFLNAIFEAAGHRTALATTIRMKIADDSRPNLLRMTMAGRFFLQHFLAKAVNRGCSVAFIEMTSEGARQHRHRFIDLDALIFTNLAPEHIESHGSLEAYADAKFELGKQLARSTKRPRVVVANTNDNLGARFLTLPVESAIPFALSMVTPYHADESGGTFRFDDYDMEVHIAGEFSLLNAVAAAELARALHIKTPAIAKGLDSLTKIPGRAEEVDGGQPFKVIVDYAHTPDSLRAIYAAYGQRRRICVLGSTGGGRDMWKRPVMGSIADELCHEIILTNEDPYDEDPRAIVDMIAKGITKTTPLIVMDRREAIRAALARAEYGDAVIITGKGTDPNICGPRGQKTPWSDADAAREELAARRASKT